MSTILVGVCTFNTEPRASASVALYYNILVSLRLRRILWGRLKTCAPVGNRRSFFPRGISTTRCSVAAMLLRGAAFQAADPISSGPAGCKPAFCGQDCPAWNE